MSKPTSKPPELAAIDPTALSQVTGGKSVASEANSLVGQVNDILGSIKNIRSAASSNGLNPTEMMLFMMLLQQRNQATAPTVVASPYPVFWGGGKRG